MKMKHVPAFTFLLAVMSGVALIGCSSRPPDRADAAVTATVQTDSMSRAQLNDHILDMWVLNGRQSRNKLDSAHAASLHATRLCGEALIRNAMTTYQKRFAIAWQPPQKYLDSSDKPLSFYQRPLMPDELTEEYDAIHASQLQHANAASKNP